MDSNIIFVTSLVIIPIISLLIWVKSNEMKWWREDLVIAYKRAEKEFG